MSDLEDFPPGVINLGRWKIIQKVAVIRSCTDAALTKDPESTQAENSSTCQDTYLGRQGKYNRECDMISIFFQTPLDQERIKPRPKISAEPILSPSTQSLLGVQVSAERSPTLL
ncbi:hypothetical protein V6N11_033982 [Hibiscus sabdariffa]|uniref:Uncharacterized protein n=1 Tax=Hibiscus sabdariffa TaxID=183260 RepID=A0ABR2S207_9ROSI